MPADSDPTALDLDDPAHPGDPARTGSATDGPAIPDALGSLREALTTGLASRGLPTVASTTALKLIGVSALLLAVLVGGGVWWAVGRSAAPSAIDLYGPPAHESSSGTGAGSTRATRPSGTSGSELADVEGSGTTTAPAVHAHAAGAVVGPGLYRLRAGARVADLVAAAGGLAPDADGDRVNLAAPVADGSRVYVPRRGETSVPSVPGDTGSTGDGGAASSGPTGSAAKGPVNLNTATVEQLDTLPGVGPTTAQAIVDHRTKNGPFRSVEDLAKVRGIGPAKLADLRPLVTV